MDIETGSSAGETLAAIVITNELSQMQEGAQNDKVCANCATNLTGAYCHTCGQSAHIHRSLLHMVEELLHGLFHFDTKAWRTIPALIFRPGQLTREYIAGKRTSYVSPLALFLFLIFFMFFVFSYTMNDPGDEFLSVSRTREEVLTDLTAAQSSLAQLQVQEAANTRDKKSHVGLLEQKHASEQKIRTLQDTLNDQDGIPIDKAALASEILQLKSELEGIKLKQQSEQSSANTNPDHTLSQQRRFTESDLRYVERRLRHINDQEKKAGTKQAIKATLKGSSASGSADVSEHALATPSPAGSSNTHFQASDLPEYPMLAKLLESADKDRQFTLYKMKKNAASLAFLLIPISLPFLWLLFAFRRQYVMFDHAVFSLYSLSFMSVLLTLIAILAKLDFKGSAALLFTLVPSLHMFSQLRHAYQLTIFEAAWRTIALLFIAFASLLAYAMVVTLFSA